MIDISFTSEEYQKLVEVIQSDILRLRWLITQETNLNSICVMQKSIDEDIALLTKLISAIPKEARWNT